MKICCFVALICSGALPPCLAVENLEPTPWWHWHTQSTVIGQGYPGFSADYSGDHSLPAGGRLRETVSLDLMVGARLWTGAEIHADGLMWQGFGVGNTLGLGGFSNGEAFKVGTKVPNVNLARLFLRQTVALGPEVEKVADGDFQMPGDRPTSRLTFTVGKVSAKDTFDANTYANDPRTQFQNWSLFANDAWDYPADALGFVPGATVEWTHAQWSVRGGYFTVVQRANGTAIDWSLDRAGSGTLELEHRHTWGEHPGAVRFLSYVTQAKMGSYSAALLRPDLDITATRDYRSRFGFGLNLEQELTANLGAFARLGWNDGHAETWMFTEVDATATLGLSWKGTAWHRAQDTVGLGGVLNDLSGKHRAFLSAGGEGITVGDGGLRAGLEEIVELYYDCAVHPRWHLTGDFQAVNHPGYNRDRGPVYLLGARLRANF